MVPSNKIVQVVMPTTALTAGSTGGTGYVDTKGYDYLQLCVVAASVTTTTQVATFRVGETDTTPTAYTDCTDIVPLCGGTATGATAGFVLPCPNSAYALGNLFRANLDLRGRKRYIGLSYSPGVTAGDTIAAFAVLSRTQNGPSQDANTGKTATTSAMACRLNVSA
jgi:hypothetical protein